MIRAEDLMFGDWVKTVCPKEESYQRVSDINSSGYPYIITAGSEEKWFLVEVEPIPLTPEILEKNGFTLDYDNHLKIYHGFFGKSHIIIEFSTDRKVGIEIHNEFSQKDSKGRSDLVTFARDWCNEFYIHEFQHALRLCRINLEIKL